MLLFSGGKDSIVMLRLAEKAFYPARIPFPVMQIDTGFDFPEVLATRDRWVERLGVRLIVASVEQAIADGVVSDNGRMTRNRLQTGTLLHALESEGFTAAFGGGRRDEEKARAKERVYSHRDDFGQWDPKNQRPELWSLYNGRIHPGEHMRIFPLSNWTELDVWAYIGREEIDIPQIYFAHQRRVFERDGMLLSESPHNPLRNGEIVSERQVRFRTVGDLTLTGCIESTASTVPEIIEEIAVARVTERGATRGDDRFSEAAMEFTKYDSSKTSFNIGRIGGGTSVNSIPFESWMEVDMRALEPKNLDAMEAILLKSVEQAIAQYNASGVREPVSYELIKIGDRPSGELSPTLPLIQRAMAATQYFGASPSLGRGSTNINIPVSMGIPSVCIGRGGKAGGAHSLHEWFLNDEPGDESIKLALLITLAEAGLGK